ncbi:MAG: ATP-binding protein [Nostoc sp. DedQUE08]|uniref:ATP-binding protein n=1 Tax=Nostoc sp. DedQUE08 TaxID=3075393 RepID=UPI002AD5A0F5|nr:ATP-binding protein [Nostoc sp. DedQUE08]MDZ8069697.1 ATP-binding protein [Nostoc sp. DedQUE08]
MSQSSEPIKEPEELRRSSKQQPETKQSDNAEPKPTTQESGQQQSQSSLQAEIERIGRIDPYIGLQRDTDLFTSLDKWRDLRICSRVTSVDRLGLSKALDYYTKQRIKRRGGLLQVPAPVVYIEVEQHCRPTDLFLLILSFLSNPLDFGPLRDLRSRTWGTFKAYGVKILIVNNAEWLSLAALNELVRIFEKTKISVILTGSLYLNDNFNPNSLKKKKYINIHNTFLKYYEFSLLSQPDTATVIQEWEISGLRWSKPLNLAMDTDIVKVLHDASQGQLRPLYENLREIAAWKLNNSRVQINPQNISKALGICSKPISKYTDI